MKIWYAVAWDVELKNELLPRTICNKPLVLYHKKDGTPVALEDLVGPDDTIKRPEKETKLDIELEFNAVLKIIHLV